ncbi:hypothetical protein Drorol1_Dr00015078 [Drosera rotundifolia]
MRYRVDDGMELVAMLREVVEEKEKDEDAIVCCTLFFGSLKWGWVTSGKKKTEKQGGWSNGCGGDEWLTAMGVGGQAPRGEGGRGLLAGEGRGKGGVWAAVRRWVTRGSGRRRRGEGG